MFNFNSVVDQVTSAAKTPLTYVENKSVRRSLETLVDANAKFVKTVYETNLDLAKLVVESVGKYDYSKELSKFTGKEFSSKVSE